MLRFLVRILGNALAISLADYLVTGFSFPNDCKLLLLAGFILAVINAVLKPILKLVSLPLIILTFGLFSLVINVALLWVLAQFLTDLQISGFWPYFWGTVIITLINWIVAGLTKKKNNSQ